MQNSKVKINIKKITIGTWLLSNLLSSSFLVDETLSLGVANSSEVISNMLKPKIIFGIY